jgi:4-hydroxy-tetrahydrodipicolinate synthase
MMWAGQAGSMTATAADALRGIFVPLITPFDADGRVATGPLETLAHEVLDAGAAGIVALGTTAESATLDRDEKHTVLDVCAAVCGARGAALIAGAGSSDTAASATVLAALAHWPQITGALVPVPSYTRPGEAGVLAHFTYLAGRSPVPLVIYHIPYRTAQPLSAAVLREIGTLPNVAGMKLAVGSVDAVAVDLLGDPPPGFAVLAGDDVFLSPLLALGAAGGILASAHWPRAGSRAGRAWGSGDLGRPSAWARRWPSSRPPPSPSHPAVIKAAARRAAFPPPACACCSSRRARRPRPCWPSARRAGLASRATQPRISPRRSRTAIMGAWTKHAANASLLPWRTSRRPAAGCRGDRVAGRAVPPGRRVGAYRSSCASTAPTGRGPHAGRLRGCR